MLQLKINTTENDAQAISDFLLEQGAESITFLDAKDQPLFQLQPHTMPLWKNIVILSLFSDEGAFNSTLPLLRQIFPQVQYETESIAAEDWVTKTQCNFKPLQFGKRLWICPPWNVVQDNSASIVILNPGVAFGTGTHPTTALCLEWLEKNIQGGESVIDYGCGSGILAISALKLGAQSAWATDHDPQALESTLANAKLNALSTSLHVAPPESLEPIKADILIANILAIPLMELAETFKTLLKKDGIVVLSGILREQSDEVIATYSQYFTVTQPLFKEGWTLLTGRLKSG